MADSFNKKERQKKKEKKRKEKAERKERKKLEEKSTEEFMYLDEFGNFTTVPPEEQEKQEIKLEDIRISTPKQSELEEEELTRKGYVKFFNEEKRFGFIQDMSTKDDYFVHEDNLVDAIQSRDEVTFEIGSGPKGPIAINVKLSK